MFDSTWMVSFFLDLFRKLSAIISAVSSVFADYEIPMISGNFVKLKICWSNISKVFVNVELYACIVCV